MKISVGASRRDLNWKVQEISWEGLKQTLSAPVRTRETLNEYKAMKREERDLLKDVGGFVGGVVEGGRRKRDAVTSRSLVTLDADYASADTWDRAVAACPVKMACYTTHSHTKELPRLRFVIPLDREVSPEEYEPIARRIAADIGIEEFDVTTYESHRLMYWPSVSQDGEYELFLNEGPELSADETLARYKNWHDTLEWPLAAREQSVHIKKAKAQGDPTTKTGVIGAFCRVYDVPAAIETFLQDTYVPSDEPTRYTYILGSTAAGVVLYEGGKFSYSHHASDPAGGQLCNAFDLVRLHLFGHLDAEMDPLTPINRMPSFDAMRQFAADDAQVKLLLVKERRASAEDDFSTEDEDDSWIQRMEVDKRTGVFLSTIDNVVIVLECDPRFRGAVAYNEFWQRVVIRKDLPWRPCTDEVNGSPWEDVDDSGLRHYLEKVYRIVGTQKIADGIVRAASFHPFHPVREYLDGLVWDGERRLDDILIHYMAAEDCQLTREITRKWMCAAVARVMRPGCKFDYMLILVGNQGLGKSSFAKRLAGDWFSDSFENINNAKSAMEQLRGVWILEMGELAAFKKAEVESIKHFVTKQVDQYRPAYGRHVQTFPRQCVFFGSTNEPQFLRDATGNRRFWPVLVDAGRSVFSLTQADIDQIWAEAVVRYKAGETLYLDEKMEAAAREMQSEFMQDSPKLGLVEEYLDQMLPSNWEELSRVERRDYIQGFGCDKASSHCTYKRQQICVQEVVTELFNINLSNLPLYMVREYHDILRQVKGWEKERVRQRTIYGLQTVYRRKRGGS